MNNRIILTGPAAAGKDFIKSKFRERGFLCDVSYTSRPPRINEVDGVDYNFISKEKFMAWVNDEGFYEWAEHGGHLYGTGNFEWQTSKVFIMEAEGVSKIKPEDRKTSLVIYIDTPEQIRVRRLLKRGWTIETINDRKRTDDIKFKDFTNYDLKIESGADIKIII